MEAAQWLASTLGWLGWLALIMIVLAVIDGWYPRDDD